MNHTKHIVMKLVLKNKKIPTIKRHFKVEKIPIHTYKHLTLKAMSGSSWHKVTQKLPNVSAQWGLNRRKVRVKLWVSMIVCACVWEREWESLRRVRMRVSVREREGERVSLCVWQIGEEWERVSVWRREGESLQLCKYIGPVSWGGFVRPSHAHFDYSNFKF